MLIIVFIVGIIVSSNWNRFLVFHIWLRIVIVRVNTSFLVLDGNELAEWVRICCIGECSFWDKL